MKASRGMGAVAPKKIQRKDAGVPVEVFAIGGRVKKRVAQAVDTRGYNTLQMPTGVAVHSAPHRKQRT